MKLLGVLLMFAALTAVHGLRCYSCQLRTCKEIVTCPPILDRCFSLQAAGSDMGKGCMSSVLCISPVSCCQGDLCNSAGLPAGPSLLFLLVSSAVVVLLL